MELPDLVLAAFSVSPVIDERRLHVYVFLVSNDVAPVGAGFVQMGAFVYSRDVEAVINELVRRGALERRGKELVITDPALAEGAKEKLVREGLWWEIYRRAKAVTAANIQTLAAVVMIYRKGIVLVRKTLVKG